MMELEYGLIQMILALLAGLLTGIGLGRCSKKKKKKKKEINIYGDKE